MNAKTLILAILSFKDTTGYDIRKMSTEGPYSYFVDIGYGSIYPTLAKLEAEGLVTSQIEVQIGKPDRKVYAITDSGRNEFINALALPPKRDKFKSEFLLIALNAEMGSRETVEQAIKLRTDFLTGEINMIREHLCDCDHPGTRWVGEYGLNCMENDLAYLQKNKDRLLELAGNSGAYNEAAE